MAPSKSIQSDPYRNVPAQPYKRLAKNEIRLAEVKPAQSEHERVVCCLQTLKRSTDLAKYGFKGLSYSWGPPSEQGKGSILLEIGDQQIIWPVTPTLEEALRRLRYHDGRSLYIWIDALCINQRDEHEKGEQVQEMRFIYQNATELLVWLGPADEESALAWKVMTDIVACHGCEEALFKIARSPREKEFQALIALFRRDYFWRIWVVQEVACAKTAIVHCGSDSMPWASLLEVSNLIERARDVLRDTIFHNKPAALYSLMSAGPKNLKLSRSWDWTTPFTDNEAPALLDLLLFHSSKGSTNPADKVYGLVGVSADRDTFGNIDYKRSPRATFIHTARHLISSTRKLNIICIKQNDDNRFHLPSWVPDWQRRKLYPSHRVMGLHVRKSFAASKDLSAQASFLEDGEVLVASGFVVDTITSVAEPFYLDGPESEVTLTLKAFYNWWTVFVDNIGAEKLAAFERTFCGGSWAPSYSEFEEDLSQRVSLFFRLIEKLMPSILKPGYAFQMMGRKESITEEVLIARERPMVSSASLRMHAKRLLISRTKLLGLAPMATETGFRIVILLGCDFPVVMQPKNGYWKLIGEAYVDGIMNGELLDVANSGKYIQEDFEIR